MRKNICKAEIVKDTFSRVVLKRRGGKA